jgi:hypothetical protein
MLIDACLPSRRTAILLAVVLGTLGFAAGCEKPIEDATETKLALEAKEAVASPGPPTTLRLVLQFEGDRFTVISVDAKRGSILEPAIAEEHQSLLDGDARLVEYSARDISGAVLVTGYFILPLMAVSEFQDLEVETRIRRREERLSRPVVKVAIPFDRSIATVEFDGLEPDDDTHPLKWERVPLGEVAVVPQDDSQKDPRQREDTGKEANDDDIE